jgi:hypothetical protein
MARKSAKASAATGAIELEVVLEGTRPRIWRRIVVSPRTTLGELHEILQVAMGWTNSHLHVFTRGDETWADPSQEVEDAMPESRVKVGELLRRKGDTLGYEYDFGDSWTHRIRVADVLPAADPRTLPCCLAGARACPPEDSGGVYGYADLLRILADPKHEEHDQSRKWAGDDFDPEAFDIDKVDRALRLLGV